LPVTTSRDSRRLRWGVGVGLVSAAALIAAALVTANHSNARGATSPPPILTTITPYQLSAVHVQLGSTTSAPTVGADIADQVAGQVFPGEPVLETKLAECTRLDTNPLVQEPCWAVSVQPPSSEQLSLAGPDPSYDNSNPTPPPTFELVLVSAADGSLIAGFSSGAPTTAPAS
jgi:hypothetical protein